MGTFQRTFREAKAVSCKVPKKTNVSFEPRTFTIAEDPKANVVGKNAQKSSGTELGDAFKEVMGNLPQNLLPPQNVSAQNTRDNETCATLVKPSRNLGETLRSGSLMNLPQNLL